MNIAFISLTPPIANHTIAKIDAATTATPLGMFKEHGMDALIAQFGDKLANGTYLYKVEMRANGKSIDHRANVTDKAFKRGFGKIVIIR